MINILTKEELIKQLEITDNGIYVIYGEAGVGKTTFIRELRKRFNVFYAPIGRLTKPRAKNLKRMTFPVLAECNQYPTSGAHEYITGLIHIEITD